MDDHLVEQDSYELGGMDNIGTRGSGDGRIHAIDKASDEFGPSYTSNDRRDMKVSWLA